MTRSEFDDRIVELCDWTDLRDLIEELDIEEYIELYSAESYDYWVWDAVHDWSDSWESLSDYLGNLSPCCYNEIMVFRDNIPEYAIAEDDYTNLLQEVVEIMDYHDYWDEEDYANEEVISDEEVTLPQMQNLEVPEETTLEFNDLFATP